MADLVSVKKQWSLTKEAFDSLLSWLDPDREWAGEKYEVIRARLIKVFAYRGCHTPEELADETINRVAKKIDEVSACRKTLSRSISALTTASIGSARRTAN